MRRAATVIASLVVVLVVAASASATGQREAALRLVRVVDGLQAPVHVTWAPGAPGLLYVVEQGGLVRVVKGGSIRSQPFLDVRAKVRAGGEQGLLGLAFAPDYAKSRQFVVNYTDRNGDTRVVRYRSDGTKAVRASAKQLLFVKQPYANHNGGMVAYGKDGLVYVGMGDGGSGGDPENRGQDLQIMTLDWIGGPRRAGDCVCTPPKIWAYILLAFRQGVAHPQGLKHKIKHDFSGHEFCKGTRAQGPRDGGACSAGVGNVGVDPSWRVSGCAHPPLFGHIFC